MQGNKNIVMDLVAGLLPDPERKEFKHLASQVNSETFFRILPTYLADEEIRSAKIQYVLEKLENVEEEVGVRIDAIISIHGSQYNYRSYNETAGI